MREALGGDFLLTLLIIDIKYLKKITLRGTNTSILLTMMVFLIDT